MYSRHFACCEAQDAQPVDVVLEKVGYSEEEVVEEGLGEAQVQNPR